MLAESGVLGEGRRLARRKKNGGGNSLPHFLKASHLLWASLDSQAYGAGVGTVQISAPRAVTPDGKVGV